jgi:hypothetical protein
LIVPPQNDFLKEILKEFLSAALKTLAVEGTKAGVELLKDHLKSKREKKES